MNTLAAIFDGQPDTLRLGRIDTPEPTGAEILVRVLGCTLCGSDRHSVEGRRAVPVPTVLGHEIVGEIMEFGESATAKDELDQDLKIGDRVTWAIVAHCGACEFCRIDLPQKCANAVKYGHEAFRPGRELRGGFAEHCLLAPGTAIVKLPEDLPLEVACPASCATATVAAAVEVAGPLADRRVLVVGAGMLGLTAYAMAATAGAAEVVCVDPSASRRDLARRFGAARSLAPGAFGAGDEFDAVLELSGDPDAIESAWPTLRIGGTMVLVGSVFPSRAVSYLPEQVVRRCLTLRGVHNYGPRHLVRAVQFLADAHRRFPFAELVDRWYPLEAIADAFAARTEAPRVGIRP